MAPLLSANRSRPTVGPRGYVALLAILIVASVGTTIATAMVLLGVWSNKSAMTLVRAVQARALAHACAEQALQSIWNSPSTTGTVSVTLGAGSCQYAITDTGGETRTVVASGTVGTVVRREEVLVASTSTRITLTSWREIP